MSTIAKDYMIEQMDIYFAGIKALVTTGGASSFKYVTGTIPANGQIVYDAPTQLGYTAAGYQVYSLGIQLSMVDPVITPNPPVVDALSVLRYEIQANGQVIIKNNYNGVVTYHARFTMPVKK